MQKIGAVMMEQMAVNAASAGSRMEKNGTSFESVMSTAGNAAQTDSKTANVSNAAKNDMSSDSTQFASGQKKVQDVSNDAVSQGSAVENVDAEKSSVLSDDTVSKVESVVGETVKDVLGLDDAALEDAMAALGLTFIDLLNPENLQQLIVYVNDGTDVTDMLTSDVMMSQFDEIMSNLSEIDWSDLAGMSKEDFVDAANQMLESLQSEVLNDEFIETVDEDAAESRVQHGDYPQQLNVQQDNADSNVKSVEIVREEQPEINVDAESTADSESSDDKSDNSFTGTQTAVVKTETKVETNVVNGQFVQEFTQTVTEVKQTSQAHVPQMQQMIDIVNQVVERIRVTIGGDTTSMEMQLTPESLGKVYLSVAAKDGVMTASFMVQSEEAKAALESQMITLRENLENKDLKVEAVEVTVSDFDFTQSNQADTEDQKEFSKGSGKQFMYDAEDSEDGSQAAESEAEAVRRQVMLDSGSSVDLTA